MAMSINEVVAEGSKYFNMSDGDTVRVRFAPEFERKETEYNGDKYVKYEVDCLVEIQGRTFEKIWSGSSNFFGMLLKKAEEAGQGFSDTKFQISQSGTGQDKRYNIEVIGGSNIG